MYNFLNQFKLSQCIENAEDFFYDSYKYAIQNVDETEALFEKVRFFFILYNVFYRRPLYSHSGFDHVSYT